MEGDKLTHITRKTFSTFAGKLSYPIDTSATILARGFTALINIDLTQYSRVPISAKTDYVSVFLLTNCTILTGGIRTQIYINLTHHTRVSQGAQTFVRPYEVKTRSSIHAGRRCTLIDIHFTEVATVPVHTITTYCSIPKLIVDNTLAIVLALVLLWLA